MKTKISLHKAKKKMFKAAWCLKVTDHLGRRTTRFFQTEADAVREEKLLISNYGTRSQFDEEFDWTFKTLFKKWVEHGVGKDAKNKERNVTAFLKMQVDGAPVEQMLVRDLRPKDISFQIMPQIQTGRTSKTASEIWQHVKIFIQHGLKRECRADNPLVGIKQDGIKCIESSYSKNDTRLDPYIVRAIVAAMPQTPQYDWVLIARFASQSGLRQSEQRGLEWDDICFKENKVYVRRKVTQCPITKNFISTDKLKSYAAKREIKVTQGVMAQLKEFYISLPNERKTGLIWPSRSGHFQSDGRYREAMKVANRNTNHNNIRWHDLRHYYGTMLCETYGSNYQRIKELMGHEKIETTINIYKHIVKDLERDAKEDEVLEANAKKYWT